MNHTLYPSVNFPQDPTCSRPADFPAAQTRICRVLAGVATLLCVFGLERSMGQLPEPGAVLLTDQLNYVAGSTANILGSGFEPGEAVLLQVVRVDGIPTTGENHGPSPVLADANGDFLATWVVCSNDCVGASLQLTATGQSSGRTATATFEDLAAPPVNPTFVTTDQSDYLPGAIAYITGGGFQAGETVTLQVLHADGTPDSGEDHAPWAVSASATGTLQTSWHVCEDDCIGSTLRLSAVGQTSGLSALAFFTDAGPNIGGAVDSNFVSTVSGLVFAVAVQTDGKVVVGGAFTTINGQSRNRIGRLNTNGTVDSTFLNGLSGANAGLSNLVVQPDGKVLIVGAFTNVNGVTRNRIARLNQDGSLDTGFLNGLSGFNAQPLCIGLQSDGKILVGGPFTNVNGVVRNRIARLNSDGSLDTTYLNGLSGANSTILAIAVQPDDKAVIGGIFTNVNGVVRNRIARLNTDGTVDTGFLNGLSGANIQVAAVALQADGKILMGGSFTNVNGVSRNGIARLNTDGTVDTTFQNGLLGANSGVASVLPQPDGKVLIGGNFSTVNGVTRNKIARLDTNGNLDTTFMNGLGGFNNQVVALALQTDGKVLVGGTFTMVNGSTRLNIARLYGGDTTPPVITCPNNLTVEATSAAGAAVTFTVTAVDSDDGPVTPVSSPASGSVFPLGTTTVTNTATDSSSNQANCSFTVTVVDTTPPVPNTSPLPVVTGQCSAIVSAPTATDAVDGLITGTTTNPLTYTTQGTNIVYWTFTDIRGNTNTQTQLVIVKDTNNPTIFAPPALTMGTDPGACQASSVALGTPTVVDNCGVASVSNNAPSIFPKGVTVVNWTVTDIAGNQATASQTVTVNDTEKPSITPPVSVVTNTDAGACQVSSVVLGTPSVADNCGVASVSNNAPAVFPKGNTTVTWTVTDTSGNTTTATQTVAVIDAEPPAIICPAAKCIASDPGSCVASAPNLGVPIVTDNCGVASVTNNAPASFPLGVTVVTWTVKDTSGNSATCQQTVTVLSSVSVSWLPPLASQPVANRVVVGQVVPHKVQLNNCLGGVPASVTVTLHVQGIEQALVGDVVFQDVEEDANGNGTDGAGANDGTMTLSSDHYQFNLDTGNFADNNTAGELNRYYRSTVIVKDSATGCILGTNSVILETRK